MNETPTQDPLDDVFGADSPTGEGHFDPSQVSHPSDMRRLETEHKTAGYREGLTVAKAASVQSGFDEGFSLGASLGQVAGRLLGTLEGIADALSSTPDSAAAAKLLADAREELKVEKLFAAEYWAPDGNWKYEVTAREEGGEVLFDDVAAQHPLVRRWTDVVDGLVETWKIKPTVLEDETDLRVDAPDAERNAVPVASTTAAPKQALDW